LHALGGFDVAVEVAGDGDLLGAHAAVEPGAALDREVALDVDVALELAGDADVAGAFDLALDGQVGRNQRLLRRRAGSLLLGRSGGGGEVGNGRALVALGGGRIGGKRRRVLF